MMVDRHERLASLLRKLQTMTCPASQVSVSPERTHPLDVTPTQVKDIEIDKVSLTIVRGFFVCLFFFLAGE